MKDPRTNGASGPIEIAADDLADTLARAASQAPKPPRRRLRRKKGPSEVQRSVHESLDQWLEQRLASEREVAEASMPAAAPIEGVVAAMPRRTQIAINGD